MDLQKILVDTDVLIDFLRKRPQAKELLQAAARHADLFISVVTLAELLAGMRASEREETETLMEGFTLVPVDEKIGRRAGELRRQNQKVLLPDCLIAATAWEEEGLLLTGNRRDYPFEGIRFFSP